MIFYFNTSFKDHNDSYYAIDLIGFPGNEQAAFDIERYKILTRVGINVFPLSFLTWTFDQKKVIDKLKIFVSRESNSSIYHNPSEISSTF